MKKRTICVIGTIVVLMLIIGLPCSGVDNPVICESQRPDKSGMHFPPVTASHSLSNQSIAPKLHWMCAAPNCYDLKYHEFFGEV